MVYKATHLSTVLWDHAELLCFYHFNQCQMNVKNWPKGCRHSLVDLSAPSILLPQVQLPSTPSILLSFIIIFVLYLSLQCETRTKINKKRLGLGHFFIKELTKYCSIHFCSSVRIFSSFLLQLILRQAAPIRPWSGSFAPRTTSASRKSSTGSVATFNRELSFL